MSKEADAHGGVLDSLDHTPSESFADEPKPRLRTRTWLALLAVGLVYFAQLVSLVGAGVQGHTIAAHFGESGKTVWITAPITILTVVLSPIVSQAADYWGRKWLLVFMTFTGTIGCIVVSRASSMNVAIIGFTITGIANGAQALVHIVTSEVLPRRWRGFGQATDMMSTGFGSVTGLLVGGALNRSSNPASSGFRTYYYIAAGIFFAASVLCALVYSPPETVKQREFRGRFMAKLAMLDWAGYFLLAVGLVLFSLGLSWSQNPYPWSDPHVSATFAVGIFFIVLLILYETWFKKDGMFHHGLFSSNRNFTIATICSFGDGIAFFATNTYFAFQISVLYETDAVIISTHYALVFLVSIVVSVLTGLYISIARELRWITVLAFLIFTSFFGAMASTDRSSGTLVWGLPVLLGVALGITLNSLVTVAQLSTPPQLISTATGLLISVRSLGGTVGIAIYQALYVNELNKAPVNIAKAAIEEGLPKDSLVSFVSALAAENEAALEMVPGVTPKIIEAGTDALLDTYLQGFQHVWIAAASFVGAAAIVAVFLFNPTKEFNMHVDAPVEKIDDSE